VMLSGWTRIWIALKRSTTGANDVAVSRKSSPTTTANMKGFGNWRILRFRGSGRAGRYAFDSESAGRCAKLIGQIQTETLPGIEAS